MTLRAFQCFAAGDHTDMHGTHTRFTPAKLTAIAAGYTPAKRSAPLVIGHPQSNGPAYGTVRALVAEGSALFAIADVGHDLLGLVRDGRYRKVSASFHLPGTPDNPTPSEYYLRHVGFLGATPPAVKAMQPLAFSVADDFASYRASVTAPSESRSEQIHRVAKDMVRASPGMRYLNAAIAVDRALAR